MLGFLGKALKLVGQATGVLDSPVGSAVEQIRKAIDGNPELEKDLAVLELEFKKLAIQEGDSIRELYAVELQSDDKFVKYARPAMLWLIFAIIGAAFVVVPIGNLISSWFGGAAYEVTFPEIPASVAALMGSIFALYTGARSYDKKKKG